MGLLMKQDTFPEAATRFYMAELSLAIASVHALGNMLCANTLRSCPKSNS